MRSSKNCLVIRFNRWRFLTIKKLSTMTPWSFWLQVLQLTACLSVVTMPRPVSSAFTAAQKTELVIIHNRLREGVFPRPDKMIFVTWNTRLESLAQAAAAKCVFEHNYGGDYNGLGENIYMGSRNNATEIVLTWHTEKVAFNYSTSTCKAVGSITTCGHYLQLITDSVLEIGCGHSVCSGNNLVFCEYSSGSGSAPYTTGGSTCSKCPTYRGLCLAGGLCVNSSMVSMSDVQAYLPGATTAGTECKLNCSNCGVSASITGVLDCYCKCASGVSSGGYCESRVANSQLPCSVCSNLTTPCLNGGADRNGSSCSCQCSDSYAGDRCQFYRPQLLNSMRLGIAAEYFCAFSQCLRVPVTRSLFTKSIWSSLRSAIATAVNSFCTASAANFALCCPSAGSSGQAPSSSKRLIADADVGYLDNDDMYTDDSGILGVAVYANTSSSANTLCPGARRKRAAVQSMVSQSVLQSALQQLNSSINDTLRGCCGLSVQSLVTYESFASAKYGLSVTAGNGCNRLDPNSLITGWSTVSLLVVFLSGHFESVQRALPSF